MFLIAPYTLYFAPPWIWAPLGASLGLLEGAKISRRSSDPLSGAERSGVTVRCNGCMNTS